tara:strand:- start:183 stop:653 length:471 start_codon:yes stop_codon:yes gene_type:complete
MKIKYSFLTLLAFIVVGCSEPDPMKEIYIQDCNADGATTETCSCLYDYGKKNMSEMAFMSSDFTEAYRKKNNIPKPGYERKRLNRELRENETELGYYTARIKEFIKEDPKCIDEEYYVQSGGLDNMCPRKKNPEYQKPPNKETIAMIVMNAMDACF